MSIEKINEPLQVWKNHRAPPSSRKLIRPDLVWDDATKFLLLDEHRAECNASEDIVILGVSATYLVLLTNKINI